MSLRWFIYQMWACSLSNKWPLHNGNVKSFAFLLSGSSELPNFVCINSLDFLSSVTLCCFFKFHLPVRTLWVYLANKHLSSSTCTLWLAMVWIFSKEATNVIIIHVYISLMISLCHLPQKTSTRSSLFAWSHKIVSFKLSWVFTRLKTL